MAITRRNSRSLTQARPTAAGRVLRVVMVLSLWHAPIPWIHVHEFEGPQVDRLETLSQHVTEFHARDLVWGNTLPDWHMHLVLPWCVSHQCPGRHHDCPADSDRDSGADHILTGASLASGSLTPVPMSAQPAARAFLAGVFLADDVALAQRGTGANRHIWGASRFRQFLETYGSSVAVRDLLSVRLC